MDNLEAIIDAHARVTDAFAELLRDASPEMSIPNLDWNVGELGAHVLAGFRAYALAATAGIEVWSDLQDGSAENERLLRQTPERDTTVIANALPGAMKALHEIWRSRANESVMWSAGLRLPVASVAGLQLGDVLVHGWDLARALRRKWVIQSSDAANALGAAFSIAPHFVAPAAATFTGTFEIRLRGDGTYTLAFELGSLNVSNSSSANADCRLRANPRTLLLTAYGRLSVWRAALSGGIIASGKKAWLAPRFKSLLLNP